MGEWKDKYWDNDGELYRDLDADKEFDLCMNMERYEIIFDIDGKRRYCFVDAVSMDEALGNFFRNHEGVRYDDIVDHMEI